MVEQHGAVLVDLEQGAGLVQVGGGEGDAELHRCERQPALDDRAGGIPRRDFGAARAVIAIGFQRVQQLREDVVGDALAVGRDIALADAIEVALAHVQRIHVQCSGDGVHHFLDAEHALRPAETAKRGVGDGVGTQPQ